MNSDQSKRGSQGAELSLPSPLPWRSPAWGAALLALAVAVVYLPAGRGEFLWDDDALLTNHRLIQRPGGLGLIWFSTRQPDYFPLTATSFWVEWRLWGLNPAGYRATNLALHALGAVLFWRVLLRLKIPGAWLAALLFAVHPVCVASVAWIAERKNTLSLVFYLLSILWYLRSDTSTGNRQSATGNRKWYWLSLLAFLLALLSKTSVVILPFVLLLCVWWQRKQWRPASGIQSLVSENDDGQRHRTPDAGLQTHGLLWRLTPFFALALILGLVTVWFQTHRAGGGNPDADPLGVRLLGGSWALWFYLGNALLPIRLSAIYPRWDIPTTSPLAYAPAALWVAGLGLCFLFRRGWGRAGLFAAGYFTVALLPVLGVFNMSYFTYSRVADHLQYLSLLGVTALCAAVAMRGVEPAAGGGGKPAARLPSPSGPWR